MWTGFILHETETVARSCGHGNKLPDFIKKGFFDYLSEYSLSKKGFTPDS
jgi:hypothetical protein